MKRASGNVPVASALALAIAMAAAFAAACSSSPSAATEPTPVVEPVEPSPDPAPSPEGGPVSPSPKDARCLPKDVAAYALQWKPPAPRQHVCTDEQIAAITPCATGHSGAPICSTRFAAAGTAEDLACERCVLTHDSDATWGATVHLADRRIFLNSAGCIALLEPSREACARDEQATHECVAVACYAGCFTNPKISESDKNACAEAAALGGCKPYAERATLCRVSLGQSHSAAEACLVEFDDAGFQTIARLFCGK